MFQVQALKQGLGSTWAQPVTPCRASRVSQTPGQSQQRTPSNSWCGGAGCNCKQTFKADLVFSGSSVKSKRSQSGVKARSSRAAPHLGILVHVLLEFLVLHLGSHTWNFPSYISLLHSPMTPPRLPHWLKKRGSKPQPMTCGGGSQSSESPYLSSTKYELLNSRGVGARPRAHIPVGKVWLPDSSQNT